MPAGLLTLGSTARGDVGLLLGALFAALGGVGALVAATKGTAGNWR